MTEIATLLVGLVEDVGFTEFWPVFMVLREITENQFVDLKKVWFPRKTLDPPLVIQVANRNLLLRELFVF